MAAIRLLLDEDVRVLLAELLRERGYDATHVLPLVAQPHALQLLPFGELLRRTLRCLSRARAEHVRDQVVWLADYK